MSASGVGPGEHEDNRLGNEHWWRNRWKHSVAGRPTPTTNGETGGARMIDAAVRGCHIIEWPPDSGKYLRANGDPDNPWSEKNTRQHREVLDQVTGADRGRFLDWFAILPLWLDLGDLLPHPSARPGRAGFEFSCLRGQAQRPPNWTSSGQLIASPGCLRRRSKRDDMRDWIDELVDEQLSRYDQVRRDNDYRFVGPAFQVLDVLHG